MTNRELGLAILAILSAFVGLLFSVEVLDFQPLVFLFGALALGVALWVLMRYGLREYFLFAMAVFLSGLLLGAIVWLASRPFV